MNSRTRTRVLGIVTVLGATLPAGWGCAAGERQEGAPRKDDVSFLAPRADTGVELRVRLRRDTIAATGGAPVEVLYFVVNGPAMTAFDNDPGNFVFTVTTDEGEPVQPSSSSSPILSGEGPRVNMVLPAGAIVGQVQDFRCIVQGRYVPASVRRRTCLASYDFTQPGTYRVVVEYRGPDDYGGNFDSLTAAADSGRIRFPVDPIAEGLRLADTATLVVVR
jgi:hypothetical protein